MEVVGHQTYTRPGYPQSSDSSSTTSSAFNSSSSLSSLSSLDASFQQNNMPDNRFSSAPLPSPSQSQQAHYFSPQRMEPQGPPLSRQVSAQNGGNVYQGQRGDNGTAPETAPFLKDFNLLAEAAKRAQMACLMRDLGEVAL